VSSETLSAVFPVPIERDLNAICPVSVSDLWVYARTEGVGGEGLTQVGRLMKGILSLAELNQDGELLGPVLSQYGPCPGHSVGRERWFPKFSLHFVGYLV